MGNIECPKEAAQHQAELFRGITLDGLNDIQMDVQLFEQNPRLFADIVKIAIDLEIIARTTRDRSQSEQKLYSAFERQQEPHRGILSFIVN